MNGPHDMHQSRAGFSLLAVTAGRFSRLLPSIHTQVAAQYGKDSDALASTGLKKTSEYKKRGPKPGGAAVGTTAAG